MYIMGDFNVPTLSLITQSDLITKDEQDKTCNMPNSTITDVDFTPTPFHIGHDISALQTAVAA